MRNNICSWIVGAALVIGLVFTGCDNGGGGE
jgi:hypothetical protein